MRAIRARADFTRRGEIGFPFSDRVEHAILDGSIYRPPISMDPPSTDSFSNADGYAWSREREHATNWPGETPSRRNFQLGERDTFSPARNLGNTLPSISRREIYCDRRYSVKYCPYFPFCNLLRVRENRGTTIWTEFLKREIIAFTVFLEFFLFFFFFA